MDPDVPATTASYPVTFHVQSQPARRNRLTVAFRAVLVLPHLLMVGGPGLPVPGITGTWLRSGALGWAAMGAALLDWVAILVTGRALPGLLELRRYYLGWRARVLAYAALLRDEYPPFGESRSIHDAYPASVETPALVAPRVRWSVALRPILLIPHIFVLALLLLAWMVTAVVGWFAVLITGRYPEELWRFAHEVLAWELRVEAYGLLLHDQYPPFSLAEPTEHTGFATLRPT